MIIPTRSAVSKGSWRLKRVEIEVPLIDLDLSDSWSLFISYILQVMSSVVYHSRAT